MLYTALGDSITAGELASSPARAYPSLVVSMLQRTRSARSIGEVLAAPGWTSQELTSAVFDNSSVYLREASSISIWVGGDNLADAALAMLHGARRTVIEQSIIAYGKSLALLVGAIRRVSPAQIILCTQYNPFPNTPIATMGIDALNEATRMVAGRTGAVIAPTEAWFAGRQAELIAGYRTGTIRDALTSPILPVHPNNRGHRVIAEGLFPIVASAHTR